jgi:tetratricopeptide (TPR) repeat protein
VITSETKKVLELFQEGRKLYNLKQFAKAKAYFQQALAIKPNDGPAKEFIERCDVYIANPPPDDWDGVYVMKTK